MGIRKHYLYGTWCGMKQRCRDVNHKSYKMYGARGIAVCDSWENNFWQFYRDMGDRPDGYTLDREDNNGNYCPENCFWSTIHEQQGNRRNNKRCVGVYQRMSKDNHYRARGTKDKVRYNLGTFPEWFEAVCARKSWEAKHLFKN